jgi:hypothetical protein
VGRWDSPQGALVSSGSLLARARSGAFGSASGCKLGSVWRFSWSSDVIVGGPVADAMLALSIVVHDTVVTFESIGLLELIRPITRSFRIGVHEPVARLESIGSLTPGPAAVLVASHPDWSRRDQPPETSSSSGALLTGGAEITPPPCEALLAGCAETIPATPPFARGGKDSGDA